MKKIKSALNEKLHIKHRTKISMLATIMASFIVYSTIPAGALTDTFTIIDEKNKCNYTFSTQLSDAKEIVANAIETLKSDQGLSCYVVFNNNHMIKIVPALCIPVISKNGDIYNFESAPKIDASNDGKIFYCKNGYINEIALPTPATVGEAIAASGSNLDSGDIVFISHKDDSAEKEEVVLDTALDRNISSIRIEHHNSVTISVDSNEKVTAVRDGQTVADALKKLKITMGEKDRINHSLDTQITSDIRVCINRVEIAEETINEAISPNVIEEKTDSLSKGTKKIKQEGINGERKVTRRVTKVDGKVESSQEVSSEVIKNPTNKVVLVGTKIDNPVPGNTSGSSKYLGAFSSTAYCIHGTTASGLASGHGRVAVDPRVIPLGTKLYIEGYGEAVAADTGGAIKGNIIDVFFETSSECYSWGRRNIRVWILG